MFKMEKLNVVRYVETEHEKHRLEAQGYKEVKKPTVKKVKEAPKEEGGNNGDDKSGTA